MDNQHRKIKGYRELSAEEIALMNAVKDKGAELSVLIKKMDKRIQAQLATSDQDEIDRLNEAQPGRWLAIGRTHFQEGLMALTRAIAQPGFF